MSTTEEREAEVAARAAEREAREAAERAAYITGLEQLAAALREHPAIPLPYTGRLGIGWWRETQESREGMAAAARAIPVAAWSKHADDDGPDREMSWFNLRGVLGGEGGLAIELTAPRDAVCTRVVTGIKDRQIEEVITPAVTRTVTKPVEVVEWQCGSLLAPAATCGRCGSPVAAPGGTQRDGQPSMRARFCDGCLDRCHEASEFDHICQVCASADEARQRGWTVTS